MDISLFHFLRPWWLLLIVPALALLAVKVSGAHVKSPWRQAIDPHLLPFVTYAGPKGAKTFFDRFFLTLFLIMLAIALAGPTLEKLPEQSRFAKAPLIVIFELSPHMLATDLTPSRLRLAQLKLRELLKKSTLGDATLIAFAGDAHVVVPSTKDYNTLLSLSESLNPDIMPMAGADLISALDLALATAPEGEKKIVVISSSNITNSAQDLSSYAQKNNLELIYWVFATNQGAPLPKSDGAFLSDRSGKIAISSRQEEFLTHLGQSKNANLVNATLDGGDVATIKSYLNNEFYGHKLSQSLPYDQWHDLGPYFLILASVLFLGGFFMAKEQWWLLSVLFILPSQSGDAESLSHWFLRDDQKAYQALMNGQEKQAAALYHDDFAKGTAYFKAGLFDEAIDHLKRVDTAEGLYNLGNAFAHKSLLKEAIAAYEGALKKDPNHGDAKHNKEVLEKLVKDQEKQQEKKPEQNQQENKDQEKQKDQQQESKGENSQDKDQKSSESSKEEKLEDEKKAAEQQPSEQNKKEEKKAEQKQAHESKETPPLDAKTLYYFDKLEKNNNHYLKRKFLFESRKKQGVK